MRDFDTGYIQRLFFSQIKDLTLKTATTRARIEPRRREVIV